MDAIKDLPLYILDANGDPVPEPDSRVWAKFMGTEKIILQQDALPGGVLVLTEFLGFDHRSPHDYGPPLMWETIVFGGPHDGYQKKYATRQDALAGHLVALTKAISSDREED